VRRPADTNWPVRDCPLDRVKVDLMRRHRGGLATHNARKQKCIWRNTRIAENKITSKAKGGSEHNSHASTRRPGTEFDRDLHQRLDKKKR